MKNIFNILGAVSFVLILGSLGAGFLGYKHLTSPEGQAKIKKAIMSDLQKGLPGVIGGQLPKTTGPALPFK